ncbi:hypothetical protein [Streptomyces sp. NBC_01460]|uniref:hypothetical protein n=1 Tax=Streptomyces sp. NBC_01460 TaxID=2903875 RepID=UPI003FCCB57A
MHSIIARRTGVPERGRLRGGGHLRRDLAHETAADEADRRVDLRREPRCQGLLEVVGVHATREPLGGQRLQHRAVGGGERQTGIRTAELSQRGVRGRRALRRGRGGILGLLLRRGLLRPVLRPLLRNTHRT